MKHLVLIETSGNQRYIFSTNKLRENIGASELTYQIGTKIVLAAVGRDYDYENDNGGSRLRQILLNETPIEDQTEENAVEIIIATSGKALLLTKTQGRAREIVREVTQMALKEMPGLTVHGAIVKISDLVDIHDAVKRVHRKIEEIRYKIPSNQQRFQRLPFVEPCATSGLPATQIYRHKSLENSNEKPKPHSILSIKKQEISNVGINRLEQMIQSVKPNVKLMKNINELEKKFENTKWISIIHADGNGLGGIFLNFDEHSKSKSGRDYINNYRKFSIALDTCTINAAGVAIENFQKNYRANYKEKTGIDTIELPFIPLILGGDDLTVICDGKYALKFTYDFLREFENQTARSDIQDGIIPQIANEAFGVNRLGICAGAAITKPHYPFHQAYDLAEKLIKSAKQVKTRIQNEHKGEQVATPVSAMDFHVLYDSNGVELKQIREKLEVDGGNTYLYTKPYIITNEEKLRETIKFENGKFTNQWLDERTWNELEKRVCAMRATETDDTNKRKLPNSQLHHIRESLFRGKEETCSEVELLRHRYEDKGFNALLCENGSLFFQQDDKWFTHFLDALDVVELWEGFECVKNKKNGGMGDEQ